MRHQVAGVRLSRTSSHRKALFSNLVAALFTHEKIRTTLPKARETRRIAERTITIARRLGDVLNKEPEKRTEEEAARVVNAIRTARKVVRDRDAVLKLFDEVGPRYLGRPGGYTRIVKLAQRPGDNAPMALLELMPGEAAPAKAEGEKSAKGAGKSAKGTPEAKAEGKAKASAKSEAGEKAETKPKARAKKKTEE